MAILFINVYVKDNTSMFTLKINTSKHPPKGIHLERITMLLKTFVNAILYFVIMWR